MEICSTRTNARRCFFGHKVLYHAIGKHPNRLYKSLVLLLVVCFLSTGLLYQYSAELLDIYRLSPLRLRYIAFFRPSWGTPPKPFHQLTHYYSENLSQQRLCELHGWQLRSQPRRVFDAILFGNELDILEIRIRELQSVVTKFVILESNTTFTGLPKPLFLAENRARYAFASSQIVYASTSGRPLLPNEDPFDQEDEQRDIINSLLSKNGIRAGDILIMSDADEIPSAHTVKLLKWCDGFPPIMHLQLKNYLYSFEFPLDYGSWKSSVHIFQPGLTKYGSRERRSDIILADAGWHCSFCFRYLKDFFFKIAAYSHANRVKYHPQVLDPVRLQDYICKGANIFDMLPQEYTYKEMIAKMGSIPSSYSGIYLPSWVLENQERFLFLLPRNCLRL